MGESVRHTASAASNETEAVLFDLDGTLLDTHELILISMDHTMKTVLGKELPPEVLMRKVGQPLTTQMADFADSEEQCEEMLAVYREYNAIHHDGLVRPFDGVADTLEMLRSRGLPLGVVTSKRHAPAMRGLSLFDLDSYFHFVLGADDCTSHKPEPGPVICGAELLGIDPRSCIYVGDSPYDIQAGNGAGAVTVAALWGMFSEEVLLAERPDYTCRDIREVPGLLRLENERFARKR